MLNSNWERIRLGEIAKISSGTTPRRVINDYWNGNIPWVTTGEIDYNDIFDTHEKITQKALEATSLKLHPPGTILLAMIGQGATRGRVARLRIYAATNQNCCAIEPSERILTDFLYYYIESQYQEIRDLSNAGGQQNLNSELIQSILVPLAPITEQRRIADILSAWDRAIDLTTQLIVAEQQRKRGLIQQLLTGKRRFKRFVCSEETQDTEIGPVPADWRYTSIGDIAQHVSERNTSGLDLPVLSCTKYEGLVESLRYFGRQIFSNDTSVYKVVRHHQFAYATNHIEEGSIGYQDLYDEALISPMYTVFEADPTVNDRFLYALLKTETYRQIFERSTSASVDRRGSLRWNEFSRIKVPLPSLSEQEAITAVLNTCDSELALLDRKLTLLKKQKQGLMQQLLTGKVRVKI